MTRREAIAGLLLSIALTASCRSTAQNRFEHFDALEAAAERAYDGHDVDVFEARFAELKAEYQRLKRPQEEVWALYKFDFDQEAARLEADLRLRLKTEKIVREDWLPLGRAAVRRATLESGLWVVLREQVSDKIGPSVRHDVMVYEISRALGFHLVPVTVSRIHNGHPTSLQMLIRDNLPGDESFISGKYGNDELHILDFLTQQLDRNPGNWLTAPGGRLVAIDNDIVYGHERFAEARGRVGDVSADTPPAFLAPKNRRAVKRLEAELDRAPEKFNMKPLEMTSIKVKIKTLLSLPERPVNRCEAPLL